MSLPNIANNAQAAGSSQTRRRTGYRAPYYRQISPYVDHYIVAFKESYTLSEHFSFIGEKFRIDGELDEGYYAKLDRELLESVRRDPGVELVEDDALGTPFAVMDPSEEYLEQISREVESQEAERVPPPTACEAPYNRLSGYPYHDYYTVGFRPGHTMAKHFAFLRRKFDVQVATDTLYYAKLDSELLQAVRRDPGVEMVEDDPLEGESGGSWEPTEEELEEARLADEEKERAAKEVEG
ncbi:hypothetical protein LTR95_006315 [Oleoguttula sp. CCFEE 5521]